MVEALEQRRTAVARFREDPEAAGHVTERIEAIVALAEDEPLLRGRAAEVRRLLFEAAPLLDANPQPALAGRLLSRMAQLKLLEGELDAAEKLAVRATQLLAAADERARLLELRALHVQLLVRRKQLEAAATELGEISREMPSDADPAPAARRAALRLALANAELLVESDREPEAWPILRALCQDLAQQPAWDEFAFQANYLLGFAAAACGDAAAACHALRRVATIAKQHGAVEDELEARLALAGQLRARNDRAGLEEAARHLQHVRDEAQRHQLESLRMAALTGQAGLLAQRGNTRGALDRCLEIADAAVAAQDVTRYQGAVALMAQIYEGIGDLASAYRTLTESRDHLAKKIGAESAAALFDPHVLALAQRLGERRFSELVRNVDQARVIAAEMSEADHPSNGD
jgi:hypothetical protein